MNKSEEQISFLLADDHVIVRQGIALLIEDIFPQATVIHASTIAQIENALDTHSIDFAVLDAQYPDGNCSQILPQLKQKLPDLKVLIFSSYEEDIYALKFMNLGADGFLSKLSDEDEIKNAIISLYEKGSYISPFVEKLKQLKSHNLVSLSPLESLSEREMHIAKLLSKGQGNLEIANQLSLKQNTVSTFKKRIFEKLQIESVVELIELIKRYNDF